MKDRLGHGSNKRGAFGEGGGRDPWAHVPLLQEGHEGLMTTEEVQRSMGLLSSTVADHHAARDRGNLVEPMPRWVRNDTGAPLGMAASKAADAMHLSGVTPKGARRG